MSVPISRMNKTPSKKPPATKPKPKLVPTLANGKKDPVEVYCRLRPLKSPNDCVCIKRLNDNTLKLMSFGNNKLESFYSFKYVFPETTTQKELFDRVGLPLIKDSINGKNGLLFTYGITSSGKTFTVTGSSQECGLIPRTLDVLFNSIEDNMARKYVFRPDDQNGFKIQSTPDALLLWQREKQVSRTPSSLASTPKVRKRDNDELKEWENRERDETTVEVEVKGNAFAVFVSYVEIYNNYIYDLLDDEVVVDPFRTKQPQSKVLREDKKRRVYVHNATEVEVGSSDEAFDLFIKGVRRRRMAHTALNTESSRSHSVFNIKVVQAPTDADGDVLLDEKFMTLSQLSLVDLAGSERSQRTQNTGERLREAGNINNSLMALRTCIDLLRENQKYGVNKIVPYRDNKLTHLFKSYFEGEGTIKMIICVNPGSEDFDETLHVMKFAETTQEVLINRGNDIPFHMRIPHPYSSRFISLPRLDNHNNELIGPPLLSFDKIDWRDLAQLNNLIEVLEQRKQNELRHHERVRQERLLFREKLAASESESMLTKQQLSVIRNDLGVRESQIKELEKKCSLYEGGQNEYMRKIHNLEKHLKETENKLENAVRAVNSANVEQERNKIHLEERLDKEKERMKRIFNRVLEEKKAQLERELCLTNEKMHLVREILTANNHDLGFFKDYLENLYPTHNPVVTPSNDYHQRKFSMPASGSRTSSATPETFSVPSSTNKRPKLVTNFHEPNAKSTPTSIPLPELMETITDIGTQESMLRSNLPAGIPVVNPRHQRSLSTGAEKWIDHHPQSNLDMGTVLKPSIKSRISVHNLKNVDAEELLRASKYALTTHFSDEQGEVETRIYKGQVIPSAGGGAQVIFNDVEKMVQSPPGS